MICFKEEKEIINIWEEGELEVLDPSSPLAAALVIHY